MSSLNSSLSGPGAIQTFVSLPQTSTISQETLEKWFDEEYAPALLKTDVVKSIWRFKAADPDYGKQNMLIYEVNDLSSVQAGKLQNISRTSSLFPSNDPIDAFVAKDTRILSLTEVYEITKHPENATTTVIYAAMEPGEGGEGDLDAWYREEHNQQMSREPGWLRTKRYSLRHQQQSGQKTDGAPSFLAIHEFGEGHTLGKSVKPLDPITEWTKKCMSQAKAIDAAMYQKVQAFGGAAS